MKMHDTLLMVCRVAIGSRNAKNAIDLSAQLGHGRNETNMNLGELWKKGLIKRRMISGYADRFGRKRKTIGYYIERGEVRAAIAKHLQPPSSKPKMRRPLDASALMSAWQ